MEEKISELKKALFSADSVIVGAGAGLSTSAGFTYSGERFEKYFSDFAKKIRIFRHVLRGLLSLHNS